MRGQDTSQSDKEVVASILDGDINQFEIIVDRYQDKLHRYAYTIVHDSYSASDVVQNSFIKAYTNLNSYKPSLSFSSWIYRIVHNEAINFIKKNRRETTVDDEEWFSQLPDTSRSVHAEVTAKLSEENTRKLIHKLPLKYQEPLLLHYFEGQSYTEISDILHIPTATVGTRINRAKKQLKIEFINEGHTG